MMHEVDLSRRKFLKFGGVLGLALGALSLPSLRWTDAAHDTPRQPEQELWLEAKSKKKKKQKTNGKKKSANESGSADWQEIA
jgi:hypothetical protein